MQSPGGNRSRSTTTATAGGKNGVIAGSVWENRMKVDEVKGGVKVFNGGGGDQSNVVGGGGGGIDQPGNQIQVYRRRIQQSSSVVNGGGREIGKSKRTLKPDIVDVNDQRSPRIQLRKTKSDKIEKTPIPTIKKTRSHQEQQRNSKDSGAIRDREMILNNVVNESRNQKNVIDYDCDDEEEDDEDDEDEGKGTDLNEDSENEIDVKEVNVDDQEQKKPISNEDKKTQMSKELVVVVPPSDLSKKPNLKNSASKSENVVIQEEKKEIQISSRFIKQPPPPPMKHIEESGFSKKPPLPPPSPPQPQPVIKHTEETHPRIHQRGSYEFQRYSSESQNKLQNLVDLVMWRDVSKSALVFGFGTFLIFSTSYTKDLNFSLISAISYLGLLYLATRFLYSSILCRGAVYHEEESNERLMVGEEEAIWLLRLILPYLNEFLVKLKSLFSGDPATTMKLAVLLFILARCGSSITIWKVARLGFFGIFIVPKVCSSYSTQLTGYGKFWVRRFRDAWDSCSHKKAVALAGFTLMWNISSVVARVWAVFMLVVAVRYYQQSLVLPNEGWGYEDEEETEGIDKHDCVSTTSVKEVVLEEKKGSLKK